MDAETGPAADPTGPLSFVSRRTEVMSEGRGPGAVVAIVGATGAVGIELIRCLEERAFPLAELRLFASARSARKTDRKSTRLNSSHSQISYAVFCLKQKTPACPSHAV